MAKSNNVLHLTDTLKVVDWLRENWEKRVQANKMTAQDIADAVAKEKGIEKVTMGNVYGILEKVFPQWQLPRVPKHLNVDARNIDDRLAKIEARLDHLEKEFGVRPLTSFLGANSQKK